ncbi:RelE family toxin-antitoxin system [Klebsiella pneumoniae]|uniref:hypothetical protein n=1 Tax=Klebsiella pneumoniae TaxID=573 RepID=UPI000DE7077F|nr:hypothetical protein [Klebsiella pneumoniae]SSN23739.1 RelE family toxin-antitoxin system [Klebsiella pneumoniae]
MTTDITELVQSLKRRAASANEFGESLYVKADDVLALVEALEKAQQRNGELETYSKTALEFREAARDENRHLKLELEIAEKRIAELESRTVKLPDLRQIVSGDRYVWSDGVYNYSQDVKVALAAAGIKVEAE